MSEILRLRRRERYGVCDDEGGEEHGNKVINL